MEENAFLNGLFDLMLRFEVLSPEKSKYAHLVFVVSCGIFGLLAVGADLFLFLIRKKSVLNLKHGLRNTLLFAVAWCLGAMIIGFFGQITAVFQVSVLACLTVGLTWPVLFTKMLEEIGEAQEPIQPHSSEV